MKKVLMWIIVPLFLVGAVTAWYFYENMVGNGATESNIAFILEHIDHRGEIIDFREEISVKSVENIRLFWKSDKDIVIEYGKIRLKWTKLEDFLAKENLDRLKQIFITLKQDRRTLEYHVYWKDQKVTRWVS
jgi:hypothetical protein